MKYYQDGFRPGDPDIKPAAEHIRHDRTKLPSEVDVLIVGTGPAGLCLAAQLAQFPEIKTLIIEKSPCNIKKGKADGISVRTMEMFQAFGFADKVKRESCWINQTSFWMPDPDKDNQIKRIGRVQDVADDSTEMPHILINQARLHELYLDVMRQSPSRLEPDYNWTLADLHIDHDSEDYPVTATLQDTGVNWGDKVQVKANYVVGCDGARSNVRKAIGGELHGDSANQAWGVMDILANTDFPDIRQKCVIASQNQGNILILPREGGLLFRIYVEMDKLPEGERLTASEYTSDHLISRANNIMQPYHLDVKQVVWWSIYEIGHRLTDRFDNVLPENRSTQTPRVFTAGDACHTHSPKAGQGMNVSMQDTFNLGWKLIHVLTGRAGADLLHSYAEERFLEAKRLIETDHKWARIMTSTSKSTTVGDSKEPLIMHAFKENLEFTGGLAVHYPPSALTSEATYQALATGEIIGKRFHSAPVIRLADAKPMQLGHVAQADARWRLYIFAADGDTGQPDAPVAKLCDWLHNDTQSPVVKYTSSNEDIDAFIDIRGVFPYFFDQLDFSSMPRMLKPELGKLNLQDYEKIFCLDHKGQGDFYAMRGIDRQQGCMILVRPDQYVATVLPLDGQEQLTAFFTAIYK